MEFYMLELESSFISSLSDVMDTCENLIKTLGRGILSSEDMLIFDRSIEKDGSEEKLKLRKGLKSAIWNDEPWQRITYVEACSLLSSFSSQLSLQPPDPWKNEPLRSEHEKFLSQNIFTNSPVFVTNYPKSIKPFYMKTSQPPEDDFVENFDLLVPQWELAGGSVREEDYDALERVIKQDGIQGLDWYLELRKFGSTRHGGFGIGWERLVGWLTGIENLRDCMAFPRSAGEVGIQF
jgi:asparaginyl-tRNA synthetase